MHQLNDALLGFGSGALQPLATLGFELLHLTLNERQALSLAFQLGLQFPRQGTTVPKLSRGIQISPVVGIENSPPRLKARGLVRGFLKH
jgi:hypothetical protein